MKKIIKGVPEKIVLSDSNILLSVLKTGDIHSVTFDNQLVNSYYGNPLDGGLINIYIGVLENNVYHYQKIIGNSYFSYTNNYVIYKDIFMGVTYSLILHLKDNTLYYSLKFTSLSENKIKLFYTFDLGLSNPSSILNGEAYISQYIDHKVEYKENKYIVRSKQNQGNLQVQISSKDSNISYSTDGFDFFGLDYKDSNIEQALVYDKLTNRNLQYEFALIALQSDVIDVNEKGSSYDFYCHVDNKEIVDFTPNFSDIEISKDINYDKVIKQKIITTNSSNHFDDDFSKESIPTRLKEYDKDNNLLSAFVTPAVHIVKKEKELVVKRSHGGILCDQGLLFDKDTFASTSYMSGIFSSQVVYGNTSFNKLTSNVRGALNIFKLQGTRIYFKYESELYLLTLPSYFVISQCYTIWRYSFPFGQIYIDAFVPLDHGKLVLTVMSSIPLEFIVTNNIIMGSTELSNDITYEDFSNYVKIYPTDKTFLNDVYPDLRYYLSINKKYVIGDGSEFFSNFTPDMGLMTFNISSTSGFVLTIEGSLKETRTIEEFDIQKEEKKSRELLDEIILKIDFKNKKHTKELDILQSTLISFANNALIHYTSPHGLEQFNGAAWGTRDLCQGPFELFMASFNYPRTRKLLLDIFSHQFKETGDFPQWFMFDRYYKIQANDSHGDIIIWPLRCLSIYLGETKDFSILDESVHYMSLTNNDFTKETYKIKDHVKNSLDKLYSSYIPNTHILKYGHGDWNDSLQPKNKDLSDKMASSWTNLLYFETLNYFVSNVISNVDYFDSYKIAEEVVLVKKDIYKYLIDGDTICGFCIFETPNKRVLLLHPKDTKTNIHYRLLPHTRAIISGILNDRLTDKFVSNINEHLTFNDGVRLMDSPVIYDGGKTNFFQRAETASNFGREIGLLYMHAQIRYLEAFSKANRLEELWDVLFKTTPILLNERVKNSERRQSNMYFSSSDACFTDRYIANKDFNQLIEGDVKTEGGWRLYSSGPGIFIKTFIRDIMGVSLNKKGKLEVNPKFNKELIKTKVKVSLKKDKTLKF